MSSIVTRCRPPHAKAISAALLLASSLLAHGQSAPSAHDDPLQIVRDASFNELRASNQGHPYRYRTHSIDGDKVTLKEVIETRDGDITRLLEKNDKPLSDEDTRTELNRLAELRAHPQEQARKHRKGQAESERDDEMIKLLPDAFLYTSLGSVHGPNGPCFRLRFEPNPDFHPPDRQAEVYHGMAGELWVDQAQRRMVRLDAHLTADVNFGWGVVGRLFKGGTILVEQRDVGDRHWENTLTRLNLNGRILMVKALRIESTDESSDFHPVPDAGYQAAIDLLTVTK